MLEIIQHQGTPEETHRRETLVFDRIHMANFDLADGRRTTAEFVPPTAPTTSTKKQAVASTTNVLNDLRALADGDHTRIQAGMRGDRMTGGNTASATQVVQAEPRAPGGLMYQTKVTPVAQTGVDVIAQVSMDADGNSMRVKLSPVFQGVQAQNAKVGMNNPVIPGVFEPGQQ